MCEVALCDVAAASLSIVGMSGSPYLLIPTPMSLTVLVNSSVSGMARKENARCAMKVDGTVRCTMVCNC